MFQLPKLTTLILYFLLSNMSGFFVDLLGVFCAKLINFPRRVLKSLVRVYMWVRVRIGGTIYLFKSRIFARPNGRSKNSVRAAEKGHFSHRETNFFAEITWRNFTIFLDWEPCFQSNWHAKMIARNPCLVPLWGRKWMMRIFSQFFVDLALFLQKSADTNVLSYKN